ncbi:MAG: hypothetical protein GF372_13855 [Candidatus Marinimicrobia bacterium]|nr:hypothetical protein [Candidatus Neomarinimicrobiota bacterium]
MSERNAIQADWFQLALRLIIAGVFLYAAVPKILNPQEFYLNILGYNFIQGTPAKLVAIWLPWAELIAALGIIFNVWMHANLRLIQAMLSGFIILLVLTLIRGIDADCGCFGSAGGQVTWWHVFGDFVLLFITTFLITWTRFSDDTAQKA